MSKSRRRQHILDLLQRSRIASQEELASALSALGEPATQATISRDLRELGVVKGHDGYRVPRDASPIARVDPSGGDPHGLTPDQAAALRRHLVSAEPAVSLVVVRTAPGHASVLAVEFDRVPPEGVVGIIAGDDTIFFAMRSEGEARRVARRLCKAAGIDEARRVSA